MEPTIKISTTNDFTKKSETFIAIVVIILFGMTVGSMFVVIKACNDIGRIRQELLKHNNIEVYDEKGENDKLELDKMMVFSLEQIEENENNKFETKLKTALLNYYGQRSYDRIGHGLYYNFLHKMAYEDANVACNKINGNLIQSDEIYYVNDIDKLKSIADFYKIDLKHTWINFDGKVKIDDENWFFGSAPDALEFFMSNKNIPKDMINEENKKESKNICRVLSDEGVNSGKYFLKSVACTQQLNVICKKKQNR